MHALLFALIAANPVTPAISDATIDANDMDACHIRLMVTRGIRSTPYQDPRVVIAGLKCRKINGSRVGDE